MLARRSVQNASSRSGLSNKGMQELTKPGQLRSFLSPVLGGPWRVIGDRT